MINSTSDNYDIAMAQGNQRLRYNYANFRNIYSVTRNVPHDFSTKTKKDEFHYVLQNISNLNYCVSNTVITHSVRAGTITR